MTYEENALAPDFLKLGNQELSPKEKAYLQLKRWIVYTEIEPGTPLQERELAEQLGISRTPLREILMRLSHMRLVTIQPKHGAFVSHIDFSTILSIFEIRVPMEKTAAALACMRASDQERRSLLALLEELKEADTRDDYSAFIQLDQAFHESLVRMSRNPFLAETLERLHSVALRFWFVNRQIIRQEYRDIPNLSRIANAVYEGNAKLAAQGMGDHISKFVEDFEKKSMDVINKVNEIPV